MLPEKKICNVCKQELLLEDFYKNCKSKDGHAWTCKKCHKEYVEKNYSNEKNREYKKKHYAKNREKVRAYQRKYYKNNPDIILNWKKPDSEEKRTYNKKYHAEYYKNNPDKKRERTIKTIKRSKERYNSDPVFRFVDLNRRRINKALKSRGTSSIKLLGCSGMDAHLYLVSLGYKLGMHIDHVVPISCFDLDNEKHQKIAFNFRNLQPLNEIENKEKYNKMPENWESVIINICNALKFDYSDVIKHISENLKEYMVS